MLRPIPLLLLAIMIAILFPGTVTAQASSTTGSVTLDMSIDAVIPASIQINGLEDIELPENGIGNLPDRPTAYFCVYMDEDGTYSLEVAATPFEEEGGTASLSFYIEVADQINFNVTRFDSFDDPAGKSHTFTGLTPSRLRDCSDGVDSTYIVPALDNAPTEAGLFTTTTTLTVRPE